MAQDRDMVSVRLTHKFAELINGIDLSRVREGEEMQLSRRDASILVAEGWAEPLDAMTPGRSSGARITAADKARKPRRQQSRS